MSYTAWVTTDPAALDGDHCDVCVLVDEDIEDLDGEVVRSEFTGVEAMAQVALSATAGDDVEVVLDEAVAALAEAGWGRAGAAPAGGAVARAGWRWEVVPTGFTAAVSRS